MFIMISQMITGLGVSLVSAVLGGLLLLFKIKFIWLTLVNNII